MDDAPILRFRDGRELRIYTAFVVAARLKEAAETLRSIPLDRRDRPGGFESAMPDIIRD